MDKPLSYEELLSVREPAHRFPLSISSDGTWIAFTVSGAKPEAFSPGVSVETAGCSQWVCHLESRRTFPLCVDAKSSWSGIWSPNSNMLAFYSDYNGVAQVWIWNADSNELMLPSEITIRPFFGFEAPLWTSDGRSIIVKAMPTSGVSDESYFQRQLYTSYAQGRRFIYPCLSDE